MNPRLVFSVLGALGLALGAFQGCTTQSFCFDDCEGQTSGGAGGTAGGHLDGPPDGPLLPDSDACIGIFCVDGSDGPTGDACEQTNGGVEICDGLDNDCDGQVDNGIDFTSPRSCGTCELDCFEPPGLDPASVGCNPPGVTDGTVKGECTYDCAQDFYDIDGDWATGCEYYCPFNPTGGNATDPGGDACGRDDDCDGTIDEDVATCDDEENCGKCGKPCIIENGTGKCVSSGGPPCTENNTDCVIEQCDPGWWDANGSDDDGCEYSCAQSNPPDEICDGLDNDCDGEIDNVDPDIETQDPDVGDDCFGGTRGECATAAHRGVKKCIGGAIACCDQKSNDEDSPNPALPDFGLRNGVCEATVGPFVLEPGDIQETCNGKDDDCDGLIDDAAIDAGGTCGTSVGDCQIGTMQCCVGGDPGQCVPAVPGQASDTLVCVGAVGPATELCNAQDDDCDGVIDGSIPAGGPTACTSAAQCAAGEQCLVRTGPADKVCAVGPGDAAGSCGTPPAAPCVMPGSVVQVPCTTPGSVAVPQPCTGGTFSCVGGTIDCQGDQGPTASNDACGQDSNCDGALTGQPDLLNDVRNCGSCGNDCFAATPGGHAIWTCNQGACEKTGCEAGFIDCTGQGGDADPNTCERSCTFTSSTELCNGVDDDCDCSTDEGLTTPTPVQVCGVSSSATQPGCTTGVTVSCGALPGGGTGWKCTFPADYCDGADPLAPCTSAPEECDSKDNDCDGNVDENFLPPVLVSNYLGQQCFSSGLGECRGTGVYVCNAAETGTQCNAADLNPPDKTEYCDLKDNDCDGLIDEPFSNKGSNATNFVRPAVTKIGGALWITQYEVSRVNATATAPGSGNGWHTSAPAGTTLDQTQACSASGKVPWFNIQGPEAAQVCTDLGGRLCTTAEWTSMCQATASCTRGYNPRGAACTSNQTGSKFCNIGPYDFDANPANGNQDGLLPTASASLQNCWTDWAGLQGNPAANDDIRDTMGNLREISYNAGASPGGCSQTSPSSTCLYTLMGGAFNTQSEDGASCSFTFYTVNASFKLYDVGFRCCFTADPTL
jgi:hypothetical protein